MSGFVPHPFAFHWSKLEAVGVLQVTQKLHGALEEIDRGERSYVQLLLSNIGVIYDAMLRAGMDLRWDRINEKQVEDAAAAALSPSAARGAAAGRGAGRRECEQVERSAEVACVHSRKRGCCAGDS